MNYGSIGTFDEMLKHKLWWLNPKICKSVMQFSIVNCVRVFIFWLNVRSST